MDIFTPVNDLEAVLQEPPKETVGQYCKSIEEERDKERPRRRSRSVVVNTHMRIWRNGDHGCLEACLWGIIDDLLANEERLLKTVIAADMQKPVVVQMRAPI